MSDHYKFFSHKQCEYYPCHQLDEINCLFCYCPLYILKDCKGNYKMIGDIKDCSGCTLPHQKESYDYIISRYQDVVKAFQLLDNKDTNDKIEATECIEDNVG